MLCMHVCICVCFICTCICACVYVVRAKTRHVFVKFCFENGWSRPDYSIPCCYCYVANTVRYQLEAISSVRPNPYPNPNPTSWKHLFRKAPAGAPQAKPEDASNAAPTGEMVAVDPVHGESDEHELPWQVRW